MQKSQRLQEFVEFRAAIRRRMFLAATGTCKHLNYNHCDVVSYLFDGLVILIRHMLLQYTQQCLLLTTK